MALIYLNDISTGSNLTTRILRVTTSIEELTSIDSMGCATT